MAKYPVTPQDVAKLDKLYASQSLVTEQRDRITTIRNEAKSFSIVILENTPAGNSQTTALRHVQGAAQAAEIAIGEE